jgi:glycine/D-amino acid oxidase-like deaminating enzyme
MTVAPTLPAWWLEEALAAEGARQDSGDPLRGDLDVDVAIVGGGYTGLWTALELRAREPSLGVAVLEAEVVGWGPSGRNGGFVHGYWTNLAQLAKLFGPDEALHLARVAERIVPGIRAFLEQRGEDAWFRPGGYLKVSTAPAQDAAVERKAVLAETLGAGDQVRYLSADEVQSLCRSPVFRRGLFYPDCATVQPARLARALRRAALVDGVQLFERTPMTSLRAGRPNVLETPRGRVRAAEVVVATNAAAAGWRPVASRLTNFGSYVVLTEPAPDAIAELGWTSGVAITDGRMFVHYFRTTEDGRVLMGSGSGPIGFGGRVDGRFAHDAPTAARAEAGLRRLLPGLAAARVEQAWGGPIDVSADHLPFFDTVGGRGSSTRIHYGLGYSGHGAGPAWLAGKTLASLVLGVEDEWTSLPLCGRRVPSLPPEPLKRVGGGLVRSAILACEQAEEAGRRGSFPARAVAALPRLLRMEIGTR